jgi:hypothetical protein
MVFDHRIAAAPVESLCFGSKRFKAIRSAAQAEINALKVPHP